jgi:hypothetical protein
MFSADRPAEKCRSTCTCTVTVEYWAWPNPPGRSCALPFVDTRVRSQSSPQYHRVLPASSERATSSGPTASARASPSGDESLIRTHNDISFSWNPRATSSATSLTKALRLRQQSLGFKDIGFRISHQVS